MQFMFKGVRKSGTFRTKSEARAWEVYAKSELLKGENSGIPNIPNKTFGDLLDRYAKEVSVKKRGERWEQIRITLLQLDEIATIKLDRLNETHVASWRDRRLMVVSGSTVRREWNILSNACTIAVKEWKWLLKNPFTGVRKPEDSDSRDRLFACDEIEAIVTSLGWADGITPDTISARVASAVLMALETGMRCGEICNLTWGDVRPTVVTVRKGKTRAATRDVPLTPYAQETIATMRDRYTDEPDKTDKVFDLKESQVDALFRKARDRCGIEDLHFHDTRHSAVTRLALKLDILSLARMIGHKDLKQLQIYFNRSAEDMVKSLS
jgi:integrase